MMLTHALLLAGTDSITDECLLRRTELEAERRPPRTNVKEWMVSHLKDGWEALKDYECTPAWHRFSEIIALFIMDAFVDMFITLCIVVNTMFMALDSANNSAEMAHTLRVGNYVSVTGCSQCFRWLSNLTEYSSLRDG